MCELERPSYLCPNQSVKKESTETIRPLDMTQAIAVFFAGWTACKKDKVKSIYSDALSLLKIVIIAAFNPGGIMHE